MAAILDAIWPFSPLLRVHVYYVFLNTIVNFLHCITLLQG